MENEAQNNNYPAAMREAYPANANGLPAAGGLGIGGGHNCSFQRSSDVKRPRRTACGVERRQRAQHCEKALYDLMDALEAEGGSRAPEIVAQLREVAVAVRHLGNP